MQHMGHSEAIDKQIYAAPPALSSLKQVAPLIDHMDQGCVFPCSTLLLTAAQIILSTDHMSTCLSNQTVGLFALKCNFMLLFFFTYWYKHMVLNNLQTKFLGGRMALG